MKKPAQQKSNRQQNRKGNGQIEQNKMVIEQEHGMNKATEKSKRKEKLWTIEMEQKENIEVNELTKLTQVERTQKAGWTIGWTTEIE